MAGGLGGGGEVRHGAYSVAEMLASAAREATGASGSTRLPPRADGYAFTLDITASGTDGVDYLDVYISTLVDASDGADVAGNWLDVARFTRHLGNAAAERRSLKCLSSGVMLELDHAIALAQGTVRHIVGDNWRVRWVVLDNSGTATFTFSVNAIPM